MSRTTHGAALVVLVGCGLGAPAADDEAEASSASDSGSTSEADEDEVESSDSSESEGDTEVFSWLPDLPKPRPACDVFEQDCPPGEKCVPYASRAGGVWDAHKCVPVLGDQAPGEPCHWTGSVEATDDCDANGACWEVEDVDGELIGTCAPFCTGSVNEPMCPAYYACVSGNFVFGLCTATCDPLVQDCERGLACYWANSNFTCIFTTQDLPAGEPCGYINDCAGGHVCIDAAKLPNCRGPSCCTPFCDLSGPGEECAAVPGTACVAFFEQGMALPGYELVGVCLMP